MIRAWRGRVPLLLWLGLVWVLLWGELAGGVLLSALLVAPLCLAACRLPALRLTARPRWRLIPLALGRFAVEVVVSSVQVAWATLARGPRVTSGVVAVPFRCASDLVLAVAVNRLSLVPGTLVIDIDRDRGSMYVYVFDVSGASQLLRAREDAMRGTEQLVRALGADAADRTEPGGGRG